MVNALCILSVVPVMVTILSGHDPSDMLILAPLCQNKLENVKKKCDENVSQKSVTRQTDAGQKIKVIPMCLPC